MSEPTDTEAQARRFLVSTSDYEVFHFWDEALAASLSTDDYDIIKLYPRGLSLDEANQLFNKDFITSSMQGRVISWATPLEIFRSMGQQFEGEQEPLKYVNSA
jgi:hypothetical protein